MHISIHLLDNSNITKHIFVKGDKIPMDILIKIECSQFEFTMVCTSGKKGTASADCRTSEK